MERHHLAKDRLEPQAIELGKHGRRVVTGPGQFRLSR